MHAPGCLLLLTLLSPLVAAGNGEAEWPSYHGPDRDNISGETGLLDAWPEGGPRLLWTAKGLGSGYSSVAIADGRIFTAGMLEKTTHVLALDLSGSVLWKKPNGPSWEATRSQPWAVPYSGARGTPTVNGSTVYHLAELGSLRAFDARTGEEKWHRELLEAFSAERPKYGLSESVLVRGERLFCCPGGSKGYMVALDKLTGETEWALTAIQDPVGYCSVVPATIDGVESLVTSSAKQVFAVDPDDGSLLWKHEFGNQRNNSATDAIVHEGLVYASCGYGGGSILLQPERQDDGRFEVEEVWATDLLDNHHGGVVRVGEHLYGSGHEESGWSCLDFKTGRRLWQSRGKGSLTYAEGKLYCLEERGTMKLVECTPESWKLVSSFPLPSGGRGLYWAHPVVCGGRLYVRHSDQLFVYVLRGK